MEQKITGQIFFYRSTMYKLATVFIYEGARYSYYFRYDTKTKIIIEEKFRRLGIDQYDNEFRMYLHRNTKMKVTKSSCSRFWEVMDLVFKANILTHTLKTSKLPLLQEARNILMVFANKMTILFMDRLSPYRTIVMFIDTASIESKQIIELIKNADSDIEGFRYDENIITKITDIDNEKNERLQDEERYGKLSFYLNWYLSIRVCHYPV